MASPSRRAPGGRFAEEGCGLQRRSSGNLPSSFLQKYLTSAAQYTSCTVWDHKAKRGIFQMTER
jgi:hypothetical protein